MLKRAVVLALATATSLALAEEYDQLGKLEREEVDAVLRERSLTLDPAPAGKIVGQIHIATREVFSERDGFLTFFNVFHATSLEKIIRRDLLFQPGEPWDQEIVDESLRGLRDPMYHNVLVILPIVATEPGHVDALVVARDVWSLRLSSRYDVQGVDIISLSLSLSENNLFGLKKRAIFTFSMDQGTILVGPSYVDPNIAGTRLTLRSAWRFGFARHGGDFEGTRSESLIEYPLWSLRRKWGASLSVAHVVGYGRRFKGLGLASYDNPDTMEVEAAPWIYRRRELATEAQVVRGLGLTLRHTIGFGHELSVTRPALTDDFPADETLRAAFIRDVLARNELISALFVAWKMYTPVYVAFRDLDTFDFREDYQMGPLVEARASAAREEIGSEANFFRLSVGARWSADWWRGLWRAAASMNVRVQDGEVIDRNPSLSVLLVSPQLGGWVRVILAGSLDWLDHEGGNRLFLLGSSNGLRGYLVNEYQGTARAIGHLELRSRPLRISWFRLGAVAFWDAGHAADAVADLSLKHSVGLGLRALIPQTDPLVFRFDWAVPFAGVNEGLPGRLSLGVEQAF